ncbi:MAG: hypothetical protein JXA37_02170 [Chloroflexia bacterium]|nr:hypothetical protein [Chloroflexia bacterium]
MSDFVDLLVDGTISNLELIFILLLPGVIYGFRRGWQEEGFTAIGLALIVSNLGERFNRFMVLLINRLVGAFPLAFAILMGKPTPTDWPSEEGLIPADNPWIQLVMYVLMILVAYRAGAILGKRRGVNFMGRLFGGLFGAMNGFLVLARLLPIFNPLEEGRSVDLPTVTIQSLEAERLTALIYGMIALIIVLFLAVAWINRKKASQ